MGFGVGARSKHFPLHTILNHALVGHSVTKDIGDAGLTDSTWTWGLRTELTEC